MFVQQSWRSQVDTCGQRLTEPGQADTAIAPDVQRAEQHCPERLTVRIKVHALSRKVRFGFCQKKLRKKSAIRKIRVLSGLNVKVNEQISES